ncbi:hypothetical protein KSP39_PZI022251 [Platanthera zijinensis]|uniref:Uncharacterized protein n=1 Tax=Platanthera zijinensis TaxID=2320716 RepID=A0AAP0AWE5_9ASPA
MLLQLNTYAKIAGLLHDEWVENADRWVAGFLEKFEEGCHSMFFLSTSLLNFRLAMLSCRLPLRHRLGHHGTQDIFDASTSPVLESE